MAICEFRCCWQVSPNVPVLSDRGLDGALVQELIPRLRNLKCSHAAASPTAALDVANSMLSGDGGVAPQVHVITDLRRSDWSATPDVQKALQRLEEIDAQVSIVELSGEVTDNILVAESLRRHTRRCHRRTLANACHAHK